MSILDGKPLVDTRSTEQDERAARTEFYFTTAGNILETLFSNSDYSADMKVHILGNICLQGLVTMMMSCTQESVDDIIEKAYKHYHSIKDRVNNETT
jgi:hypothetical protein